MFKRTEQPSPSSSLENQKDGKVDVSSKMIKDHEITAEYQIVRRRREAVTEVIHAAVKKLKAHETGTISDKDTS